MIRKSLALTCALFLFVSFVAFAGGEKGSVELGIYAGYAKLDDYTLGALDLNPSDNGIFGARFGVFLSPTWSLETSVQHMSTETDYNESLDSDVTINSARLNVLFNPRPGKMFRPFVTLGTGLEATDIDGIQSTTDIGYNAGFGFRWFVTNKFGIRLDARSQWTNVEGLIDATQGNYEGTIGVLWSLGGGPPPDEDMDGVPDKKDACARTPRGAIVDESGCPLDADRDGVYDGLDKCPDTPRLVVVDSSGCPTDRDGDGVFTGLDSCPGTPAGALVSASGCPSDSDSDGVYDGLDKCPDTPLGATVDSSGCPKDADGDGVPDGLDRCPDTPLGATVDRSGCPKDLDRDGVYVGIDRCPDTSRGTKVDEYGCQVLFEEGKVTLILEGVNFHFNSDELTNNSIRILDQVAASLREWPDINVEIGGHTDSSGNDKYNMDLSLRRARSVRDYLIGKGIGSTRLTAKGFGEEQPVASNSTEVGRAENRRVELRKAD